MPLIGHGCIRPFRKRLSRDRRPAIIRPLQQAWKVTIGRRRLASARSTSLGEEFAMLTRRATLHHIGATAASLVALRSGVASAATSTVRTPVDFAVPRGACDCHVHVFGDPKALPFAAERTYTPPMATAYDLLELQ